MVIKNKFTLLKDVPNILTLSPSSLKAHRINDGLESMLQILGLLEKKIDHFTKKKVYKLLKSKNNYKYLDVVYLPKYSLPVAYNKTTNQILVNLNAFSTREISTMNPTARDLYGCIVYGICFSELITKQSVPTKFAPHIVAYLLSVFIRVFGKEYGLLGTYSTQIPKLRFLLSCYIYSSFFGMSGDRLFRDAAFGISYDYRNDLDKLRKYNFDDIMDLIKALDELKVFPGINKHNFASKVLRLLSIHFMPALEDCARFVSVLTTSNVPGISASLSPAFYYRYNETEFDTIMKLAKRIF